MSKATVQVTARVDVALVAAGLFPSRTRAGKAVEAGRVMLDGAPVARASHVAPAGARLEVSSDADDRWVGRAALKLVGALEAFAEVSAEGALCLDAGASTGGFTQVLLETGAKHVHAVDVGHDQLHPSLREDHRVSNHEGVNVRALSEGFVPGGVDLVVGDLSFISLTMVTAPLAAVTREGGELVLMVKPQFEVGRERLGRTGVVSAPEQRREAVEKVVASAEAAGLSIKGIQRSPLEGQDGNAEFFLWLHKPEGSGPANESPGVEHLVFGPAQDAPSGVAVMLEAVDYR